MQYTPEFCKSKGSPHDIRANLYRARYTCLSVEEAINTKDRPRGLGIIGMMEKIELAHGTMNIQSRPEGCGSEINIEIPYTMQVLSEYSG